TSFTLSTLLTTRHAPPIATLFPYTTLFRSRRRSGRWRRARPSAWRIRGCARDPPSVRNNGRSARRPAPAGSAPWGDRCPCRWRRSEEHTSELQSRENLVCRLLLEKKKNIVI